MKNFNGILAKLPNINNIKEIKLFNAHGFESGVILNKPGTQGSVKLYNHLFLVFGELNTNAAIEGLKLYCEHVEDAKNNPGKHPNIDRLLDIIKTKKTLKIRII
jgi:hypothetical protein